MIEAANSGDGNDKNNNDNSKKMTESVVPDVAHFDAFSLSWLGGARS